MTGGPDRCLTCGDVAVVLRVVAIDGDEAVVELDGRSERVAIELTPEAVPGSLLLCHAGIALATVVEATR